MPTIMHRSKCGEAKLLTNLSSFLLNRNQLNKKKRLKPIPYFVVKGIAASTEDLNDMNAELVYFLCINSVFLFGFSCADGLICF